MAMEEDVVGGGEVDQGSGRGPVAVLEGVGC